MIIINDTSFVKKNESFEINRRNYLRRREKYVSIEKKRINHLRRL